MCFQHEGTRGRSPISAVCSRSSPPCVLENSHQICSQTPLPSLTQHPSMPDPKVQGPPYLGFYCSLSSLLPQPPYLRTQCGHRRVNPSKWLRRTGDFRLLTEDSAQWGTWIRLGGPWGLRTFPNPQLHLNQQTTNFKAPLLAYWAPHKPKDTLQAPP